jgi:hypothetical protein
VRAALTGALVFALGAVGAAAATAPMSPSTRLPRAVFDVIPPESRVAGPPGRMRVVEHRCRPGRVDWARRRIVDIAVQEWAVFGLQTIDATRVRTRVLPEGLVDDAVNPALARPQQDRPLLRIGRWEGDRRLAATIAGYWSATPDGRAVLARQNRQWRDGEGEISWVQPWSAAFVSWVMCEAGLDQFAVFARDISHRVYIDQAIRARDGQAPEAAYVAHDPGEAEIVPGDLLCNARGEARYATLADRRRELGRYAPTHCDIVVSVQDDRLAVIGGNVINGVSLTLLPLVREPGRFPRPAGAQDLDGARTLFAHLQLQAAPIAGDALAVSPTLRALTAGAATPTSEPESSPDDAEEGDAP